MRPSGRMVCLRAAAIAIVLVRCSARAGLPACIGVASIALLTLLCVGCCMCKMPCATAVRHAACQLVCLLCLRVVLLLPCICHVSVCVAACTSKCALHCAVDGSGSIHVGADLASTRGSSCHSKLVQARGQRLSDAGGNAGRLLSSAGGCLCCAIQDLKVLRGGPSGCGGAGEGAWVDASEGWGVRHACARCSLPPSGSCMAIAATNLSRRAVKLDWQGVGAFGGPRHAPEVSVEGTAHGLGGAGAGHLVGVGVGRGRLHSR